MTKLGRLLGRSASVSNFADSIHDDSAAYTSFMQDSSIDRVKQKKAFHKRSSVDLESARRLDFSRLQNEIRAQAFEASKKVDAGF